MLCSKACRCGETLEFSNAMAALNCTQLGARGGIGTLGKARALIERGERRSHHDFASAARARMIPLRSTERSYGDGGRHRRAHRRQHLCFPVPGDAEPGRLNQFVLQWGIVPDRLQITSLFTSMFLHGGWMHLIGNMLFLWVFGRNIEDLIGGARFLRFTCCAVSSRVLCK